MANFPIETRQIWSIYAGAFQTYHTVRAEHHQIPNLTDLTTPSYYVNHEVDRCHPSRLWVGAVMHRDSEGRVTYGADRYYRLTKDGFKLVREEKTS